MIWDIHFEIVHVWLYIFIPTKTGLSDNFDHVGTFGCSSRRCLTLLESSTTHFCFFFPIMLIVITWRVVKGYVKSKADSRHAVKQVWGESGSTETISVLVMFANILKCCLVLKPLPPNKPVLHPMHWIICWWVPAISMMVTWGEISWEQH